MDIFPSATTYELFYINTPWGELINEVVEFCNDNICHNAKVIDLMCGPGYLLGKLSNSRNDLYLVGMDINQDYIIHAKNKYQNINFINDDVINWHPEEIYDVIICTGGLHHLNKCEQIALLHKIQSAVNENGFVLFADPCIDNYSGELQRKLSVAWLGYNYLSYTIGHNGNDEIIRAVLNILYTDVFDLEHKMFIDDYDKLLSTKFSKRRVVKTWPKLKSEYGDYWVVCKNK